MGVPPVLVEPVFKEATVEFIAKEIICCRRECPLCCCWEDIKVTESLCRQKLLGFDLTAQEWLDPRCCCAWNCCCCCIGQKAFMTVATS